LQGFPDVEIRRERLRERLRWKMAMT